MSRKLPKELKKKRKFTILWQKRSAKWLPYLRCREKDQKRQERERQAASWNESDLHLNFEEFPTIHRSKANKAQILDIYAAVCLYEYKIRGSKLRELLGDLIGIGRPIGAIPQFVEEFIEDFIEGPNGIFTLKVKMLAEMNKEYLLGRVDAACQRHTPIKSTSMVPLQAEESTQSRPSISVSAP